MTALRRAAQGRRLAFLFTAATVLAACGGTSPRGSAVVRDSAGIQIVENTKPALDTPWRIDPEPVVSIGMDKGEDAYQLSDIDNVRRLQLLRLVKS